MLYSLVASMPGVERQSPAKKTGESTFSSAQSFGCFVLFYVQNPFAAEAPPWTLLGILQHCPRPPRTSGGRELNNPISAMGLRPRFSALSPNLPPLEISFPPIHLVWRYWYSLCMTSKSSEKSTTNRSSGFWACTVCAFCIVVNTRSVGHWCQASATPSVSAVCMQWMTRSDHRSQTSAAKSAATWSIQRWSN